MAVDAGAEADGPHQLTLAGDPRAAGSVRRIKSAAGLAGFCVAGCASWQHGLPVEEAGVRALAGGLAAYLVAWAAAVAAWRHLIRARFLVRAQALRQAREAALAARADAAGETDG